MSSSAESSSSFSDHDYSKALLDSYLSEKHLLPLATELNSENIDTSTQKWSENEAQNTNLRRKILEREKHVKELSSSLQLEKGQVVLTAELISSKADELIRSLNQRKGLNAETNTGREELSVLYKKFRAVKEDQLLSSLKAVQGHLQCQIQRKEAYNDELKGKMQTLERKITEWKLQADVYKRQILALRETSKEQMTDLKEAIRSQKQRAQRFEAAVENLTSDIREREVKLSEILSASNDWKRRHDAVVEENTMLKIQREGLKKQITSLLEDLKKKEEWRRSSVEKILGKLNSVTSEKEKICLENKKLKASIATLQASTVCVENELLNMREKEKLLANLAEHYKTKVQKLQTVVEESKSRWGTILNGNKKVTENKCLEVDKVRGKTEAEPKELGHVCDLLTAAEEKQQGYQEKLMSWEWLHVRKRKTLRELQVQDEDGVTSVSSDSLEEEKRSLQKKYEDLKRQLEIAEFQNEKLACQLREKDESLQSSKVQLEKKLVEYNGLTRQLESALEEGRKTVAEELEKILHKEQTLQTKVLIVKTEVREGQEEKTKRLSIFYHNEKRHEVRLKELEKSLQQSENKNQRIQNHLQFLKASYLTIFGRII